MRWSLSCLLVGTVESVKSKGKFEEMPRERSQTRQEFLGERFYKTTDYKNAKEQMVIPLCLQRSKQLNVHYQRGEGHFTGWERSEDVCGTNSGKSD